MMRNVLRLRWSNPSVNYHDDENTDRVLLARSSIVKLALGSVAKGMWDRLH